MALHTEKNTLAWRILGKVNKCHHSGLFRDNLQHWLEDFARLLKVQFTSNEGVSNDAPIHDEYESEIDHYTGHYVPYFLRRREESHRFITCARACETGTTVYTGAPNGKF